MLTGILTALLLLNIVVLIVLITVFQHGNEGGIGSSFGGGNSAGFFGASGGANIIIRATWVAGATFFLISLSLAWLRTNESFGVSKEIDSLLEATVSPAPVTEVSPTPEASVAPEASVDSAVPAESPAP
jgi:preprotein translocase subunit SecG